MGYFITTTSLTHQPAAVAVTATSLDLTATSVSLSFAQSCPAAAAGKYCAVLSYPAFAPLPLYTPANPTRNEPAVACLSLPRLNTHLRYDAACLPGPTKHRSYVIAASVPSIQTTSRVHTPLGVTPSRSFRQRWRARYAQQPMATRFAFSRPAQHLPRHREYMQPQRERTALC